MMGLLKNIGKGILYIIGLPFFLLTLALVGTMGIFVLIGMFFKSIFLFFTGRSLDDELPEDRVAREVNEKNNPMNQVEETHAPEPEPFVTQYRIEDTTSIEDAVFGPRETIKQPEPEPEPEPVHEEPKIDPVKEEPIIREYVPHNSKPRIVNASLDDEKEEPTNISFGGDDD